MVYQSITINLYNLENKQEGRKEGWEEFIQLEMAARKRSVGDHDGANTITVNAMQSQAKRIRKYFDLLLLLLPSCRSVESRTNTSWLATVMQVNERERERKRERERRLWLYIAVSLSSNKRTVQARRKYRFAWLLLLLLGIPRKGKKNVKKKANNARNHLHHCAFRAAVVSSH